MRPALRLQRIDSRLDKIRKLEAMLKEAHRDYRAELVAAHRDGMTTQSLATHRGTSWSRLNQLLKQGAAEEKQGAASGAR